jgi:hypothetical protein
MVVIPPTASSASTAPFAGLIEAAAPAIDRATGLAGDWREDPTYGGAVRAAIDVEAPQEPTNARPKQPVAKAPCGLAQQSSAEVASANAAVPGHTAGSGGDWVDEGKRGRAGLLPRAASGL